MARVRFASVILPMPGWRQAALLTLMLPLIFTSHLSRADPLPPAEEEVLKERVSQVTNYVRQQALQGVHILPTEIRDLTGWLSGGWRPVKMQDDETADAAPPAADQAPGVAAAQQAQSVGFGTNFHHKGFLPTHDTMMMGFNASQSLVPGKLGLSARPYWGQSWDSLRAYYGTEASLDIAQKADGMPWGKIVVGYVGGEDTLTDHGHGMEAHGDVDLTEGWKFTTGIRQNSSDGNSNYMMIKWKLEFR
jgi:hypothetical protein